MRFKRSKFALGILDENPETSFLILHSQRTCEVSNRTDSYGILLRFRLKGNHTGGRTVRFQNLQRECVELGVGGRQLA